MEVICLLMMISKSVIDMIVSISIEDSRITYFICVNYKIYKHTCELIIKLKLAITIYMHEQTNKTTRSVLKYVLM